METGKQAVLDANVGPLHEKLVQLLGRLKFRTSYSQNVLQHSVEVAYLCGLMADELGLNGALARRCGLLHDIGKAADHEMEGRPSRRSAPNWPSATAKRARKCCTPSSAITTTSRSTTSTPSWSPPPTPSAPRGPAPVARRWRSTSNGSKNWKRWRQGFPGVEHAYAIQAGRELRVIANAGQTTDSEALKTCRNIARSIEQHLNYPGEIKVTVVRETRAVEIAK